MLTSIIIPTLNEESHIQRALQSLLHFSDIEVIISDGGSSDRTCDEVKPFLLKYPFIQLVHAKRGRAPQMNAGAKTALGDWFLFLHADTIIPERSWTYFLGATRQNAIRAGSFLFSVDDQKFRFRIMSKMVNLRTRLFKLPYGDQALFVRKDVFETIGAFRDDYPLMEDVEFVTRLRKAKGFKILQTPIITSSRRFQKDGYLKRIAFNMLITILYHGGVHPKNLVKYY